MKTVKYITVLDFEVGEVFQYEAPENKEYVEYLKAFAPVVKTTDINAALSLGLVSPYKIYNIGLSTRSYNALVANGIHTIKELLAYSDDELIKFKNLGRFSVKEIRQRVETYQYKWKEEHDQI